MTRRHVVILGAAVLASALAVGAVLALSDRKQEMSPVTGPGPYRGSEPPAGIFVPDFSLEDVMTGETIAARSLRGQVVVITFVDTKCTDKCPLLASAIAAALRLLPADARAQTSALAISVDPVIDTRPNVARFLRERRAEQLTYLSGSLTEMNRVWKSFGVLSAHETGDADAHSADVRVFNAEGEWVATQHVGVDLTPANLAHDVELARAG